MYYYYFLLGIVDSPWFGTSGSLLTALVIIKFKIVLDLKFRKRDYEAFCQAVEGSEQGTILWKIKHSFPHIYEKINMTILGFNKLKFDNESNEQLKHLTNIVDLIVEQKFAKFLLRLLKEDNYQINILQNTYDFNEFLEQLDLLRTKHAAIGTSVVIGAKRCLSRYPGLIEILKSRISDNDDESEDEDSSSSEEKIETDDEQNSEETSESSTENDSNEEMEILSKKPKFHF